MIEVSQSGNCYDWFYAMKLKKKVKSVENLYEIYCFREVLLLMLIILRLHHRGLYLIIKITYYIRPETAIAPFKNQLLVN